MAIVGGYGDMLFEVSDERVVTWRTLTRRRKAAHKAHDVLGAQQRLQYVGLELGGVELTVALDARFVDIREELARLDAILEAGGPRTLLLGDAVEGKYVLESYSETRKHTDGYGVPLWSEVSLTLKEYQ